jgi:hypothetical protein
MIDQRLSVLRSVPLNLRLEVVSQDGTLTENGEDIASALAACYLLARRRASTVWLESDSDPHEMPESKVPQPEQDQDSTD